MSKTLTISIVTYNPGNDLVSCLDSLRAQTFRDFEIQIIDNHSSDGTIERIKKSYPEVQFIEQNENLGFGKAHNIVINQSDTPWILVLNQDVELKPNALEEIMSFTTDQSIGSIGPKLYFSKNEDIIDTTGIKKLFFYAYKERNDSTDQTVWGISGSCALYRRKALDSIAYENKEYFDESFFMYKEDVDIAERLNKKGWKAQFASKAIGYHQRTGSKQSSRLYRAEYIKKNSYKNHLFILFKHARFLNLPVIAVYELLKFCFLLITSPKTLTVVPEVIEQAPKMIKRRYV